MARPITPLLTMQLETVGEIVRTLRSRRDLEQVELARACGWRDASAVSRIETDRIRPTRRTLLKLAENLADPAVTGTAKEIRAWLFLAAGILPTAREVEELSAQIPDLESWQYPASVMDFGWHLWRTNEPFRRSIGIPDRYAGAGRNYVEMFFQDEGPIRKQFGDLWIQLATVLVSQFHEDTTGRTGQRWFTKLLTQLKTLPDFEKLWDNAGGLDTSVHGWLQMGVEGGKIGTVRSPLTADPRLIVGQFFPEDSEGRSSMEKYGALE